jgi:hypothetical protein
MRRMLAIEKDQNTDTKHRVKAEEKKDNPATE